MTETYEVPVELSYIVPVEQLTYIVPEPSLEQKVQILWDAHKELW